MSTVTEIIRDAIYESAMTDSTESIHAEDAEEHSALAIELSAECDDSVGGCTSDEGARAYTDYWGACDAGDWSVRLYDVEVGA